MRDVNPVIRRCSLARFEPSAHFINAAAAAYAKSTTYLCESHDVPKGKSDREELDQYICDISHAVQSLGELVTFLKRHVATYPCV
jgi:hypothetical protein